MAKVVYALFREKEQAAQALEECVRAGVQEEDYSLLVDEEKFTQSQARELPGAGTDAKHGMSTGALIGGVSGAILAGLAAGPFGLLGIGPLAAMVFGAAGGGLYGALGGALYGSSIPTHELEEATKVIESGGVLLTVQVDRDEGPSADQLRQIFEQAGALRVSQTS